MTRLLDLLDLTSTKIKNKKPFWYREFTDSAFISVKMSPVKRCYWNLVGQRDFHASCISGRTSNLCPSHLLGFVPVFIWFFSAPLSSSLQPGSARAYFLILRVRYYDRWTTTSKAECIIFRRRRMCIQNGGTSLAEIWRWANTPSPWTSPSSTCPLQPVSAPWANKVGMEILDANKSLDYLGRINSFIVCVVAW